MAYLDNTTITVDAVLTKKGRERLGQGRDAFNITKFAVSDDEIDYTLYNTAHPLGTNYYSNIIESMPVLEAIPDESQTMRYKLTSLTTPQIRMPVIELSGITGPGGVAAHTIQVGGPAWEIEPTTVKYNTAGSRDESFVFDSSQGYTLILFDEEAATVTVTAPVEAAANYNAAALPVSDLANFSSTIVKAGKKFSIVAKAVTTTRSTKITVFGNETGVTKTIALTVNPV
tara:strand:+ start:1937 stop:2623 length:687 start_codon:yes stop_codon:yes gene_type:complete